MTMWNVLIHVIGVTRYEIGKFYYERQDYERLWKTPGVWNYNLILEAPFQRLCNLAPLTQWFVHINVVKCEIKCVTCPLLPDYYVISCNESADKVCKLGVLCVTFNARTKIDAHKHNYIL